MSSIKLIRDRIKAISNTAKITKAMEMVAASKMKKAQLAALANRRYAVTAWEVLLNLKKIQEIENPLIKPPSAQAENVLAIVITSDKGLCGSFNTSLIKKVTEFSHINHKIDFISIGKKGQNFLHRLNKNIIAAYVNFPISPRVIDILPITKQAIDSYRNKQYKQVVVFYTDFISTLKQVPQSKTLLPFQQELIVKNDFNQSEKQDPEYEYLFEPSVNQVLDYLIPRILESQFYQMILESIASEQSARMVAMKNATDAANDLIDDLNLTYNQIRQASITQELAEISAAANAMR